MQKKYSISGEEVLVFFNVDFSNLLRIHVLLSIKEVNVNGETFQNYLSTYEFIKHRSVKICEGLFF